MPPSDEDISLVADLLAGSKIDVGGQAMSEEDHGSFTGEISALSLELTAELA